MSFAKALGEAQSKPDGTDFNPGNLFQGKGAAPSVVTEEQLPGQIPGVATYAIEYHAQRFFMGRQLSEIDGAMKIFTDHDDSGEFCRVQNLCAQGKAVEMRRLETFLQDGSVVIWLEWGEQREVAVPSPADRDYLTEDELRGPTTDPVQRALAILRKEAAAQAEKILTEDTTAPVVEEPVEEVDDEPVWGGAASDGEGPEE